MSYRKYLSSVSIAAAAAMVMAVPAQSAFIGVVGNNSIDGSLCVGFDCVANESFGFDTIRMKENNVRLHYDDTSTTASFPSNDWRIEVNSSSNGGSNHYAIQDATAGRNVVLIEAGAPANAIRVDSGGNVGFSEDNPVTDLHITSGNTPTVRLEQNGSSGFTPQTWDMAGNETNFFIRDATNGSTLPFRIFPSAPSDALNIEGTTGDVGVGITNPSHPLHVVSSGTTISAVESSDEGAVQIRLISDSANRRIVARTGDDTAAETQIIMRDNRIELVGATTASDTWATVDADGIELPNGASFTVNGTDLNVPDYVFAPDYQLMPLTEVSAFIAENSHLPNVPSAAEINASSLNMTEMQLTLLRKVEELTLYTLAQEERIESQQKHIDVLNSKLDTLLQ